MGLLEGGDAEPQLSNNVDTYEAPVRGIGASDVSTLSLSGAIADVPRLR